MSVEISPAHTLGFPRPLTRLVAQTISIHNPHPHPVAFKVKTTAPKQYTVRPNAGRVESGETVEVQVLLQPLTTEPPPHAKCKDKFLVQSAYISPDDELRSGTELWSQAEKNNKEAIHEQKIKCAYLAPEDGVAANGIREEDEDVQESRVMEESAIYAQAPSSPVVASTGHFDTPTKSTVVPPPSIKPVNVPETETSHAKAQPKEIPSLGAADIQAVGTSPTNVSLEDSLAKSTSDSEKLKIALAEIDRLRTQLSDAQGPQVTGLRKRGVAATASAEGPVAAAEVAVEKVKEAVNAPSGVPVEVVAALVVGVFVMTYLFF